MTLRLGKKPYEHDPHDFRVRELFAAAPPFPNPPSRFGHGLAFHDWLMLGNGPDDTVAPGFEGAGDCVFAGGGHETMLTTKLGGHPATFTGRNAIDDYSAVTGYVVGDDSTDQGTDVRQALKYRQKVGLVDAAGNRHKIGAYAAIDPEDFDELVQAVYVFTAVGIGFEFPSTAWDQFDHGLPWDVVPDANIEGGHYVPVVGRNARTTIGVVSWARRVGMTRAFYEAYCDEAWAIIFPEELRSGHTERGYSLVELSDWLAGLH